VRHEIASVSLLTVLLIAIEKRPWGESLGFVGVAFSAQSNEFVSKAA